MLAQTVTVTVHDIFSGRLSQASADVILRANSNYCKTARTLSDPMSDHFEALAQHTIAPSYVSSDANCRES